MVRFYVEKWRNFDYSIGNVRNPIFYGDSSVYNTIEIMNKTLNLHIKSQIRLSTR